MTNAHYDSDISYFDERKKIKKIYHDAKNQYQSTNLIIDKINIISSAGSTLLDDIMNIINELSIDQQIVIIKEYYATIMVICVKKLLQLQKETTFSMDEFIRNEHNDFIQNIRYINSLVYSSNDAHIIDIKNMIKKYYEYKFFSGSRIYKFCCNNNSIYIFIKNESTFYVLFDDVVNNYGHLLHTYIDEHFIQNNIADVNILDCI